MGIDNFTYSHLTESESLIPNKYIHKVDMKIFGQN